MKVLIVNTSDHAQGTDISAGRLMQALNNNGVKAKMLVRYKQTTQITVARLPHSPWLRFKSAWEHIVIRFALRFNKSRLPEIDIARTGTDITSLAEFKEADVIHLHRVNQGFLSLNDINRIIASGKPVVWTMYDQWPFTGICHHSGTCNRYETECHDCPLLGSAGSKNDLSTGIFRKKARMLSKTHIVFVACSRWLEGMARHSTLMTGQEVTFIPNTINTAVFRPGNRTAVRMRNNIPTDKKLLLFDQSGSTVSRKGIDCMIEACRLLKEEHPDLSSNIGIISVGNRIDNIRNQFPFPVYAFDYVSDEKRMADIYNMADLLVTSSPEDNHPNTIMEAMSCGVPCVGFRIGGIAEMIDHQVNGYLAEPENAEDLAEGILFTLRDDRRRQLSEQAFHKALSTYGEAAVTSKYISMYHRVMDKR